MEYICPTTSFRATMAIETAMSNCSSLECTGGCPADSALCSRATYRTSTWRSTPDRARSRCLLTSWSAWRTSLNLSSNLLNWTTTIPMSLCRMMPSLERLGLSNPTASCQGKSRHASTTPNASGSPPPSQINYPFEFLCHKFDLIFRKYM